MAVFISFLMLFVTTCPAYFFILFLPPPVSSSVFPLYVVIAVVLNFC